LGNYAPILDKIQNVELVEAWENETHTYVSFMRDLDTCDGDEDVAITVNTKKKLEMESMKFIYK
jgi:hypothetical protein